MKTFEFHTTHFVIEHPIFLFQLEKPEIIFVKSVDMMKTTDNLYNYTYSLTVEVVSILPCIILVSIPSRVPTRFDRPEDGLTEVGDEPCARGLSGDGAASMGLIYPSNKRVILTLCCIYFIFLNALPSRK